MEKKINNMIEKHGLKILGLSNVNGLPENMFNEYKSMYLIGNQGASMEIIFEKGLIDIGKKNPLDTWTRGVLDDISASLDCPVVYPFEGPPYYPFQRWAVNTGLYFLSPLKLIISPHYGLWQGLRGALLFEEDFRPPADMHGETSPCETCRERSCLKTCPVSAFSEERYDVVGCARYLDSEPGKECAA